METATTDPYDGVDTENDEQQINNTILEFLSTFHTISNEPQCINDLTDGVALFEALSEIAPDYFDHTTIARHLGDNWALKNSNLRKLLRNIEHYYHTVLHRTYNNNEWSTIDLQKMARYNDYSTIRILCQFVIAAAVTCPEKQIYISRIMEHMNPNTTQVIMKNLIQQSLSKLTEYYQNDIDNEECETSHHHNNNNNNDESHHNNNDDDYDEENELVFGDNQDMMNTAPTKLFHSAKKVVLSGSDRVIDNDNNRNIQQQLDETIRELTTLKLHSTITTEEYQKSELKLSTIIEDLQDRLMKRQDELILVEEELKDATTELEETKSKLQEIQMEKMNLEDDLDVMRSKAQQLHKAEAMVVAYKKKLDSMGTMNQQMEDLEGQAEKYLRQIMTLESEVKKSNALQKTVTLQEDMIRKLEKNIQDYTITANSTSLDIIDLKNRLQAAESTKKMYEDELNDIRMQQQVEKETAASMEQQQQQRSSSSSNTISDMGNNNNTNHDQREKMMRLEIENQQLREQLSQNETTTTTTTTSSSSNTPTSNSNNNNKVDQSSDTAPTPFAVAVPAAAAASTSTDTAVIDGLKADILRLTEALSVKEQENIKIASDKDKLEAYTKRTLAKFQDKYLVALQECKAKLKEKQDKIELLEKRSQTERNVQKREERLLSSAIYELGLGIMQNKLKSTTTST